MDNRIKEAAKKAAAKGIFFGGRGIGELADINEAFGTLQAGEMSPVQVGVWLVGGEAWEIHVTGQTYPHKSRLRGAGFRWNGNSWEMRFMFYDEASCINAFRAACDAALKAREPTCRLGVVTKFPPAGERR